MARESAPETVAKLHRGALVMVSASGGIRSWMKRWV
jgi:hypothetical protein